MRFVGIDPSTKTGFVALDDTGNVLIDKELTGIGKEDPKRLVTLEDELYRHLQPGDEIVIEDAAMGTQKAVTTGMIHGGLRSMIYRKGLEFNLVNPLSVKKYVAVTGWTGDVGKKRRLKDKEKKEAVKAAVLKHFGYTHKSDNVIDAYIMARIALNLYRIREYMQAIDTASYQLEVVQDILGKRLAAK